MPQYHIMAVDAHNVMQKFKLSANNEAEAKDDITRRGLTLIEMSELKKKLMLKASFP